MALTFTAGTSVESTASVTSTTVTLPSGLAAGDYTVIVVSLNAASGSITTPAGWTDILTSTHSTNGSTSDECAIFYRAWQSGDTDPVVTTSNGRVAATPFRVQGADATTFVDVAATVTQTAAASATSTAPSITPTSAWLVCVFNGRDATSGTFMTPFSNLSATMTEIAEASGKSTSANNAGHCIAYENVTAGVATGTRQVDPNVSFDGGMAISFSLNAAVSATSIAVSDTGASADTATVSAAVAPTDTGHGADGLSSTAAAAQADTGHATDAVSAAPTLPAQADTGHGTDAVSAVAATLSTITETATGTDAFSHGVTLAVTDSASSADAFATAPAVPLPETVTTVDTFGGPLVTTTPTAEAVGGTDTFAATQSIPAQADTGAGADALTAQVTVPAVADTATSADAIVVAQGNNPTLPDTGHGTDAFGAPQAAVALADNGSGADGLLGSTTVAQADSVASSDSFVTLPAVPLPDTSHSTETIAMPGTNDGLPETSSGTDAVAASAILALGDTAHSTDNLTIVITVPLADLERATDALALAVILGLGNDAATATDDMAGANLSITSPGSMHDSPVTPVSLAGSTTTTGATMNAVVEASATMRGGGNA